MLKIWSPIEYGFRGSGLHVMRTQNLVRRAIASRHHSICSEASCTSAPSRPPGHRRCCSQRLVDVNAVVEIGEVRQIVDPRPTELRRCDSSRAPAPAWAPPSRSARAVHARLGGWNARKAADLDRGMAVAAVDPQPRHMMLVGKGNRLRTGFAGISEIWGALQLQRSP